MPRDSKRLGGLPRALTSEEKAAIKRLEAALKDFPETLTLQAGTGGLNVLVLNPETGDYYFKPYNRYGVLESSIASSIDVRADGGDPW
jgi:hypothetical protein